MKDMSEERLVEQLYIEAWKAGFTEAIYNHTDHGHTELNRKKIQNFKKINDGIKKDLLKALNGGEA